MRTLSLAMVVLGALVLSSVLLIGCPDDPGDFRLGECRLGDTDCRIR